MGIPTVPITATRFIEDSKRSAISFGFPSYHYAAVPDCLTHLDPDEIKSQVEGAFDSIVEKLTSEPAKQGALSAKSKVGVKPATVERFEGPDLLEAFHNMNKVFIDRGWGDGFPLIPPTPKAVDKMLSGTSRKRDEIVAILIPGMGIATVEKIAINAVMAGCSPEHLPILITAVEAAMSRPEFLLRTLCMSTSAFGVLLLVNGPIAKEVGLNSGQATLVPGGPSRVNVAIGRGMRLILLNVGHAYPQIMDMSTIGSPRKYGLCIAENEAENPWGEPFHVERGYHSQVSTVSVFAAGSDTTIGDTRSYTAEGVLKGIRRRFSGEVYNFLGQVVRTRNDGHALVLMCPAHARHIAREGWSKKAAKIYLHQNAKLPAMWFKDYHKGHADMVDPQWRWVLDAPDDLMIPVVESPDNFDIVVVGGQGTISLLWQSICGPVTREIKR